MGDGKVGEQNDGVANIKILGDILVKTSNSPLVTIVESTYPSLLENLSDDNFLRERAILAPTFHIVDKVNEYVMSLLLGMETTYLSFDSICK